METYRNRDDNGCESAAGWKGLRGPGDDGERATTQKTFDRIEPFRKNQGISQF